MDWRKTLPKEIVFFPKAQLDITSLRAHDRSFGHPGWPKPFYRFFSRIIDLPDLNLGMGNKIAQLEFFHAFLSQNDHEI